jgi:hypothetical protein
VCWIEEYNNDEINLKERSGDSKEDVIPDFVYDVSNMVVGCNFMNNISNHNSAKRKGILHLKVRRKKIQDLEWEHNYSHVWINLLTTF